MTLCSGDRACAQACATSLVIFSGCGPGPIPAGGTARRAATIPLRKRSLSASTGGNQSSTDRLGHVMTKQDGYAVGLQLVAIVRFWIIWGTRLSVLVGAQKLASECIYGRPHQGRSLNFTRPSLATSASALVRPTVSRSGAPREQLPGRGLVHPGAAGAPELYLRALGHRRAALEPDVRRIGRPRMDPAYPKTHLKRSNTRH